MCEINIALTAFLDLFKPKYLTKMSRGLAEASPYLFTWLYSSNIQKQQLLKISQISHEKTCVGVSF